MAQVMTVTGAISAEALGHCQPHEHLFVSCGPATDAFPALLIDDEARSTEELVRYRAAGGDSLLDAQPGDAGRNAQVLRRMSEASGVKIVTVTGFHLPMFYRANSFFFEADEEVLYRWFARELNEGIQDEPGAEMVRAGAVKAALGAEGCAGRTAVLLRAAARAAAQAGVPLILHTDSGADALEALKLCTACGLPRRKVLVCHADRQARDFTPHEAIARAGAMLDYDTIGRFKYHDDAAELKLIRHMIDLGYAGRLLLSLDTTRERLSSYGGSIGLTYLLETFLPLLRAGGIRAEDIDLMTTGNARRLFEA